MTTLLHERGTLGFALVARLEVQVQKLVALAVDRGATPTQREAIAREWIHLQALRVTANRSLSALERTGIPAPRGRSSSPVVGGEPARDEARARAARAGRPAARAERAVRRLLADPAAPQRQHDRGRHVGDPAQHRRRARARAAEVEVARRWISRSPHSRRSSAARRARFLEATPRADLGAARRARLDRRGRAEEHGGAGLTFLEEAVLHEEAGRALLHAPALVDVLPAPVPARERPGGRRGGRGELDARTRPARPRPRHRATNVAIVGGDTIWELEGASGGARDERRDRPLGVVSGGEAGRGSARPTCSRRCARGRSRSSRSRRSASGAGARADRRIRRDREQFGGGSARTRPSRTRSRARTRRSSWRARSRGGRVVRRARRGGRAGRRRRGEGRGRRRGGARLRARDPGARRDRLHLGARAAPAVQARARDPVVGGVTGTAPRRGRESSARPRRT